MKCEMFKGWGVNCKKGINEFLAANPNIKIISVTQSSDEYCNIVITIFYE